MKRKDFIITAAAAVVAVSVTPLIIKQFTGKKYYDPLIMPLMLGNFCDEETIKAIGNTYKKQTPEENTKAKLINLLLIDEGGKKTDISDKEAIIELLEKKVQKEFDAYQIMMLNGWVITRTEARQCALFTLS